MILFNAIPNYYMGGLMELFTIGALVFLISSIVWLLEVDDVFKSIIVVNIDTYLILSYHNFGRDIFPAEITKWIIFAASVMVLIISVVYFVTNGLDILDFELFAFIMPMVVSFLLIVSTFITMPLLWFSIVQKIIHYIMLACVILGALGLIFYLGTVYSKRKTKRDRELEQFELVETWNSNLLSILLANAPITRLSDLVESIYQYLRSKYAKKDNSRYHFYSLKYDETYESLFSGWDHEIKDLFAQRLLSGGLYKLASSLDIDTFKELLIPERFSSYIDISDAAHKRYSEEKNIIINQAENDYKITPTDENKAKDVQQKMRELFHSFLTPMNTINRATKLIKITEDTNTYIEVIRENIPIILNSVALVNSLLYAYKSVAMLDFATSSKIDVKCMANDIIQSLNDSNSKFVKLRIIGDQFVFKGYSNDIIIALLLPLLQNAFEAAIQQDEICIEESIQGEKHLLRISNPYYESLKVNDLMMDGFSTKHEADPSHTGLGLSTVRHISKEIGIEFKITITDQVFNAMLSFPN